MEQWDSGIVACELLLGQDEHEDHPISMPQYEIQKEMEDPVAFTGNTNPDIMYVHEAMRAPNQDHFLKAMDKELDTPHLPGALGSDPKGEDTNRDQAIGHGLGHVPEAANQHKGSLQMESQAQHQWWTVGSWGELLGDLLQWYHGQHSGSSLSYLYCKNGKLDKLTLYWPILRHWLKFWCT